MFRKGQNVDILTIIHVHRRRFQTVLVDTLVQETRTRHSALAGLLEETYPALMWYEWDDPQVELVFSDCAISIGLQPTLFAQ